MRLGPRASALLPPDEIVKWTPYFWLRPLVPLLHEGINQIVAIDRNGVAGGDLNINPRSVVGDTFARRLQASGQFREILTRAREPVDEDRHRADALIRVSVPMWACYGYGRAIRLCSRRSRMCTLR